jgi:Tol biopolymer transport system component
MGSSMPRRLVVGVCTGVVALVSASPAVATFPGRNGAIAFAQRTGTGDSEPQFVERTRLVTNPPGRVDARILLECELTDGVPSGGDCTGTSYDTPSYSPDGGTLVFDAGERLGVIDADGGGGVSLLGAVTADDGSPAFSPGGGRIAFTGTNDRGTTDIYVRRVDGGGARLIVHDAGEPAWSSRDRIAYVRSGNIYTAGPAGGRRRFVTSGISPDWSPNGRRLVLVRPLPQLVFDGPTGRMFIVRAGGRGLQRLGRRDDASHPVWSPDGRWVAFDGFDLGVFAKRLGSRRPAREVAPTQISGESGFIVSSDPAWRPRRPGR